MSSEKSVQIKVGTFLRYFVKKIFVSSDMLLCNFLLSRLEFSNIADGCIITHFHLSICFLHFSLCPTSTFKFKFKFFCFVLVCHFSPFVIPFSVVQRYQQKNALICSLTNRNANTFILIIIRDKKGFSIF